MEEIKKIECEHDFKTDKFHGVYKDGTLPPEMSGEDTEVGKVAILTCTKCGVQDSYYRARYEPKMNNYQKAKEEGIKLLAETVAGKFITDKEAREALSSFAEKIKEGRDKDLRGYLEHRPNCNYYKNVVFDCDCGLVKLLSSDSQTIKE